MRKSFYHYRIKTTEIKMSEKDPLLLFFKALADANRLKIVGLLARQEYTVEQLAAMLHLGASTVSHHLSRLSEAGLVSATARSYYNYYHLETARLEEMARRLLSVETLPNVADVLEQTTPEQKIIRDFLLPDGRLKTIPAQRKKLLAVLGHIVNDFQPGVRYSEKQVNEMLAHYHEDTASLRRELVGSGLMAREGGGGEYWRIEQ
jgi:DNA-binding transcriptional ArsR family regulator